MKRLISIITKFYNLFKVPEKIGDVLDERYLIIGIQKFYYNAFHKQLVVTYFIQDLTMKYKKNKVITNSNNRIEAVITIPFEKLKNYHSNRTYLIQINDLTYLSKIKESVKVTDFLGFEFNNTDLLITVSVQPIYPIGTEKAKRLRLETSGLKAITFEQLEGEQHK